MNAETPEALDQVLLRLRGLLAEPSENEDDPFSRIILQANSAASGGGPVLVVPPPDPKMDPEQARDLWRSLIARYAAEHGARPCRIALAEGRTFAVVRDPEAAGYPLRNKVALVTGAAGAIGAGICRELLSRGCRVAAADIVPRNLDALVAELQSEAPDRIRGVIMDVTAKASVADGFRTVTQAWGGMDIVVVNAGIAMVAPLMDMDVEEFRRLERVNVEGTLLTLAEAGRCLRRQGTGGDIVLISTKNVFAPGAQFGAYSATKAASHQLARIASLEYAPFGVRVNMVAPDAVFSDGQRKSGLWAEVGPSRMRARGLDEKGLEEYYRTRNLLKARVTATHVARAVLFFVTRQTPTTGATIPVDGGLPDSTPR